MQKVKGVECSGTANKTMSTKPCWRVPIRVTAPTHQKLPHKRAGQPAANRRFMGNQARIRAQQPYQHYHAQLDAFQRNKDTPPVPLPPAAPLPAAPLPPAVPPPAAAPLPPAALQVGEKDVMLRCEDQTGSPVEPYQIVAAARNEYLQRRQEANQYKLRAEKQLGLRPCTAECNRKPGGPGLEEMGGHENQHIPQDRKHEGQQEYLRQLDLIRQQYHQDMRQMRLRAETETQPQNQHGTFVVEKSRELEPSSDIKEKHKAAPVQDIEAALRKIRDENRNQRRDLQRKKGIMFEIRLDDEETTEAEKLGKEEEEEDKDVDPLNQTLSFEEGEELKFRDWSKERKWWSQRTPQTLLNALANMDVNSVYSTAAEPEGEEDAGGRRRWVNGPPNTLLNALAQAELTSSTLDSVSSDVEPDKDTAEKDEEEEQDSDVEMDEERLEPRSDDDDTNFEESEDELREAVEDSMRNLYIMEDSSSDENTLGNAETPEETKENEHQRVQPDVQSSDEVSAGSLKVVPSRPEEQKNHIKDPGESQTDRNSALNPHQAT